MDFIKIESLDNLEWNKTFNIKEPIFDKSNIIDSKNIDLMFVPLIGFDKYNHRLGYGKGYYDRYLKNNNNIVIYGLGYKETNIEENMKVGNYETIESKRSSNCGENSIRF